MHSGLPTQKGLALAPIHTPWGGMIATAVGGCTVSRGLMPHFDPPSLSSLKSSISTLSFLLIVFWSTSVHFVYGAA